MKKLILMLGMLLSTSAWACDDTRVIHAILGEARGEGANGMYAVACAIRNRGTLRGVYGADARIAEMTPELWHEGARAWYSSEFGPDVTHGANSWENIVAFGRPKWTHGARTTARIGHHVFYAVKDAPWASNSKGGVCLE